MRRTHLCNVAVGAALLAIVASGCSEDTPPGGDVSEGECVGESAGDVTLSTTSSIPLPGGGTAGIGTVDTDEDPNELNLILGDATKSERDAAIELEVGDTFTFKKTTYTLAGFCEDSAWLNESSG